LIKLPLGPPHLNVNELDLGIATLLKPPLAAIGDEDE
jgi:hypothetical protein